MTHIKIHRQTPSLDMTPMVDLAFLLVTFFMLTTQFAPEQPVAVETPTATSTAILPDTDMLIISISKEGAVFFEVSGKYTRQKLLQKIGDAYQINFTPEQINNFSLLGSFGIPVADLSRFLAMSQHARKAFHQNGIPCDLANNELSNWIALSRSVNPKLRIAVKGDKEANYPVVRKVMDTLIDGNITNFNLITDMEEGS